MATYDGGRLIDNRFTGGEKRRRRRGKGRRKKIPGGEEGIDEGRGGSGA